MEVWTLNDFKWSALFSLPDITLPLPLSLFHSLTHSLTLSLSLTLTQSLSLSLSLLLSFCMYVCVCVCALHSTDYVPHLQFQILILELNLIIIFLLQRKKWKILTFRTFLSNFFLNAFWVWNNFSVFVLFSGFNLTKPFLRFYDETRSEFNYIFVLSEVFFIKNLFSKCSQ